jgi:hypothetical protein
VYDPAGNEVTAERLRFIYSVAVAVPFKPAGLQPNACCEIRKAGPGGVTDCMLPNVCVANGAKFEAVVEASRAVAGIEYVPGPVRPVLGT